MKSPLEYNPFGKSFHSEHISKTEVKQLVNTWLNLVNTAQLGELVGFYAPEAVMLPTLSNEIRIGREEISDYFVQFLGRQGLKGTVDQLIVQVADDTAVASGVGEFSYQGGSPKDPKPITIDYRFTFVFQQGIHGWQILTQHSSLVP